MPNSCIIPGCGKKAVCRGWCNAHHHRFRAHGDPLGGRETMDGEPLRYLQDVVLTYEGDDCLPWPYGQRGGGYGTVWLNGRNQFVCRLACEEKNGPPPTPEHEAAHSCGNGHSGCCTKRHLSWKTTLGNQADRVLHGTTNRGERNGFAKLTEADVLKIRALRGKLFQREIAAMFNISQTNVGLIQRGGAWAHVQGGGQ